MLILAASLLGSVAFAQTPAQPVATPAPAAISAPAAPQQVLLSTNLGDIVIELNAARAPKTVENFLGYVRSSHYDGTVFHRVIPDFMIQGGGYMTSLSYKSTREPVVNEANNGLKNLKGTVAMARTGDPNSATSQFFINTVDNSFLNYTGPQDGRTWGYCVFGKVVQGMDVVEKIRKVQTVAKSAEFTNLPVESVVIQKATVMTTPEITPTPPPAPVAQ